MIFHLVSLIVFGIAIQGHEERAEPHIRQSPWLPNSISHHDDSSRAVVEVPFTHNNHYIHGYQTTTEAPPEIPRRPIPLRIVNRPLQVTLLAVIMTAAVVANGSVIANISRDSLKLRMVHFLLIRHVCIADCLGTMLVLPVPLVAMVQGEWRYGDTVCAAVSTTTASLWTMHLLAVALYRADRVLAVWLPTGRYPIFSVRTTNICLVLIWVGAILGSYGATITFGHIFQPALALCIPNVPLVFFIIVFAGYCIGLVSLTTGYVLAFVRRRRRKRKRERESKLYAELCDNAPFEPTPDDLIEDIESCGGASSERSNRHRRALSDQYSASKGTIFTPSSRLTHRRVWSESAAAYCTSNLTSIVARSTQMSCDSSSFPQNSSDTNINDYERLTEDYGSSDMSVKKLTHSMSFDEASLSSQPHGKDLPRDDSKSSGKYSVSNSSLCLSNGGPPGEAGVTGIVRRPFLFTQSKSFDQADINGRVKRCRYANHVNSMSMHESIIPAAEVQASKGSFVSNLMAKSKSARAPPVVSQGDSSRGNNNPACEDSSAFDSNVLPNRASLQFATDCVDSESPEINIGSSKPTLVPLSMYSLPVDTLGSKPPLSNKTVGVIIENQGSTGGSCDSIHDVVPPLSSTVTRQGQAHRLVTHPYRQHVTNQELYEITNVDAEPGFNVEKATPGVTSGQCRAPSCSSVVPSAQVERNMDISNNNPSKKVNFNSNKRAENDNNNVIQVRMVRKHRPRTRVKHFRPKGKTGPAKRAIASYAVSVGHLLLYLPAMFVVGLKGATLPPGAALFCGLVVYCEFIVQPIALLLVSPRLRVEVIKTIYCLIGRR